MVQFQLNSAKDFKEFHTYARNFMYKERTSIPNTFITKIQNLVVKQLGLKDLNQLRDRYDGQAFMDSVILKIAGLFVLEKHLNIALLQDNDIFDENIDLNIIFYKNKKLRLITFFTGCLPLISVEVMEPLIFCSIQTDFRSGSIYGVLTNYDIKDKSSFNLKESSNRNEILKFIGFKNLKDIESI